MNAVRSPALAGYFYPADPAALRDEMYELKTILADEANLKPWERIKLMTGEE